MRKPLNTKTTKTIIPRSIYYVTDTIWKKRQLKKETETVYASAHTAPAAFAAKLT